MKLYKITAPAADDTNKIVFAGSQADARKARIDFEAPFKSLKPKDRPEVKVEEIDVPTDKKGLIDFLNGLVG